VPIELFLAIYVVSAIAIGSFAYRDLRAIWQEGTITNYQIGTALFLSFTPGVNMLVAMYFIVLWPIAWLIDLFEGPNKPPAPNAPNT